MADEQFSGRHENELPSRHVISYSEIIAGYDTSRIDWLMALEKLIMAELELNETQMSSFLRTEESGFLVYESELALDDDVDEKSRLQAELYALAPLILLWSDVRETKPLMDAASWLRGAVDVALVEADFHDEDDCVCDDPSSSDNSCALSPLCPVKMVTKTLVAQAIEDPRPDMIAFEDPRAAREMVRMQVSLGGAVGLLSKQQVKKFLELYHQRRPLQSQSEDFGD